MDYSWFLALHIVAIAIWIGGMLVNGVILGVSADRRTIAATRRWNQRLVAPAMALAWALGITLAVKGGWFQAHWLSAKLVFVLALSALHGVQSGTLRRMVADPSRKPSAFVRLSAPLAFLGALVIVFLVVAKPF